MGTCRPGLGLAAGAWLGLAEASDEFVVGAATYSFVASAASGPCSFAAVVAGAFM